MKCFICAHQVPDGTWLLVTLAPTVGLPTTARLYPILSVTVCHPCADVIGQELPFIIKKLQETNGNGHK
jgi:hypothetical protein